MDDNFKEILGKVKIIVAEVLNVDEQEIHAHTKFIDDLGAESLDFITLLMEFEDQIKDSIPEEDAKLFVTVGDAVNYILKKAPVHNG